MKRKSMFPPCSAKWCSASSRCSSDAVAATRGRSSPPTVNSPSVHSEIGTAVNGSGTAITAHTASTAANSAVSTMEMTDFFACNFISAVCNYFVCIHVALSTRTGLPYNKREVIV